MTHLVSLPNRGRAGSPKFLHSDDPKLVARWVAAEDRPGFGVYDILNPLKPGAAVHGKDNMAAVAYVFADVDAKDIEEALDEAAQRLRDLPLRPTRLTESGHGWHVVYELKEPVECDDPDFERAIALQAELIDYLAADPSVRPWSLLRRPDTTNSKDEPHVPCRTLAAGSPVDITEIETLCELVRGTSLLTRKAPKSNGHDSSGAWERKAPTDIVARLEAMKYGGDGLAGIHATQRDVSASELRNGCTVEFVVEELLAATRQAVEGDARCADWDWAAEEHGIRELCFGFINKLHPELYTLLPDALRERWEQALADGRRPKVFYSSHIGWHVRTFKTNDGGADGDAAAPETDEGDAKAGKRKPTYGAKRVLVLRPFVPFDPATLPPREWLYGKHYQRRTVSMTAGPGGMGKTSQGMVECVAMATARNLLGEQPTARLRVWLHNGEDPLEEIHRRLAAICQHYDIPQEELQGQLWITSGNEFPLRVAKGYANMEVDDALLRQISTAIGDNQIDVAAFDPFVTMHAVSEGDPGKMDTVIRLFAAIADEHDAAIELNHHVRKPAAGTEADHDVFDIRGVMAITDAVRAARVLNRMSKADAENAGIDEVARLALFRVDKAKGNYSPAQAATWRRFVGVELPNGDNVGVVTPWDFPGQGTETPEKAAADRQAEHVFLQLLDKFMARGANVSANPGPTYAPARFASEREAKVAKVSKAALKAAMNRLLDAGRVRSEPTGRSDRSSHRLVPWQGAPK